MPGKLKNPFEQNLEEEEPPPIVRRPKPGKKKSFLFQKTEDGDPTASPQAPSPTAAQKGEVQQPSPKRLPVLELPKEKEEEKVEREPPDEVQLISSDGKVVVEKEEVIKEEVRASPVPEKAEAPEEIQSRPPTPSDLDAGSEKEIPLPVDDVSLFASPAPFTSPAPAMMRQQVVAPHSLPAMSYQRPPTPPPQTIVLEIRLPESQTTAQAPVKEISRSSPPSRRESVVPSKTPSVAPWEGIPDPLTEHEHDTIPHSGVAGAATTLPPNQLTSSAYGSDYDRSILPSINDISASMEALQKSMSPQKDFQQSSLSPTLTHSSVTAAVTAPEPAAAVVPEELRNTLQEIMASLKSMNGDVLTSLSNVVEGKMAAEADATSRMAGLPPPTYPSSRTMQSNSKEIKREVDRLRSLQQQSERRTEIEILSQEVDNLKNQQKEQEQVRASLLDLQLIQQSVMSEQFQKQLGATLRQKAIDKQQRAYLAKYMEYQKELNKTIKKATPVVAESPLVQSPQFGTMDHGRPLQESVDSQQPPPSQPASTPKKKLPETSSYVNHFQPSPSIATPEVAKSEPLPLDDEVAEWLTHIRLERYIPIFATHQITMGSFTKLTDADIVEMGITALGPRKVIQNFIEEYHKKRSPGRVVVPSSSPVSVVRPLKISKSVERSVERSRREREREREHIREVERRKRVQHPTIDELEAKLLEAQVSISRQQRLREQAQQQQQQQEWSVYMDSNTNQPYYVNNRTNQTQWEPPPDVRSIRTDAMHDVL